MRSGEDSSAGHVVIAVSVTAECGVEEARQEVVVAVDTAAAAAAAREQKEAQDGPPRPQPFADSLFARGVLPAHLPHRPAEAWAPGPAVPSPMPGPVIGTAWVVPGRLARGRFPMYADALALVKAGVTTFVNLRGETGGLDDYLRMYPRDVAAHKRRHALEFLFFPVGDFCAADARSLAALARELRARLERGEVLFVHCRGGRGRTGMVVAALLCALYGVPAEAALSLSYPETTAQARAVVEAARILLQL
jgi:hypothetical protein